jgi:hypothetical protein
MSSHIHFLPRPCHNYEFVKYHATGVAMTSVLHLFAISKWKIVETTGLFLYQFLALEHSIRKSFILTPSNHKYSRTIESYLNHLKIVRKYTFMIDSSLENSVGVGIELSDCLWVLLEDIDKWRISSQSNFLSVLIHLEFIRNRLSSIIRSLLVLGIALISRKMLFFRFFTFIQMIKGYIV